jgi:raffinose/stachyose/melibiose transport system permease protein
VRRSAGEAVFNYGLLSVFALLALAPLATVVIAALHPPGAPLSGVDLPSHVGLGTFRDAWTRGGFSQSMRSSAIVTVAVVAATSVLSILAGYGFGATRFPGRDVLFAVLLLGLVIPFEALVVPLYYRFRDAGLTDTYWALILPQVGLSVSFGTFWMRAFFRAAPQELVDAARVDGAGSLTVLWRVLVPIGRPAVVTMVLLVGMWTWNEFLLALVMISDEAHRTAPLGLSAFSSRYGTDVPGLSAAAILVALPVVVVYVFLQRHFIRGMLAGAIKA